MVCRRFAKVAILSTLLIAGCGRAAPPENAMTIRHAASGVVAVATHHSQDGSVTLCSGALVAPNLVLTARHCVSDALTQTPACDARGESHNGAHVARDADPHAIAIYTGTHIDVASDTPRAHAERTVHPSTSIICDADVAFLVLDHPIDDVTVLPMRLHGPVESGDYVVPVGFGGGATGDIGTRVPRASSEVLSVGPGSNHDTGAVLGPREFEVQAATCKGDSGGPALDVRTGEVVGVVSRGASCWSDGNHVYTRMDSYARLAINALDQARHAEIERIAANR
jgi:V8-like Glu-specific endopeptidase